MVQAGDIHVIRKPHIIEIARRIADPAARDICLWFLPAGGWKKSPAAVDASGFIFSGEES